MGKRKLAHTKKKRGRKPKLVPELVAASLARYDGNLLRVAKKYNVQRNAVQNLVRENVALQQVLRDAREGMLDEGESSLYSAVKKGEAWAVCFFLKTQGKARGYIERTEQTGADGSALGQGKTNVNVAVVNAMPSRDTIIRCLNSLALPIPPYLREDSCAEPVDRGDGVCAAPETNGVLVPHNDS